MQAGRAGNIEELRGLNLLNTKFLEGSNGIIFQG
jgi:hypothetical protein